MDTSKTMPKKQLTTEEIDERRLRGRPRSKTTISTPKPNGMSVLRRIMRMARRGKAGGQQ